MKSGVGWTEGQRSPRVLFVTSWYPEPGRPMAGAFVRDHARALAGLASVTVLHLPDPKEGRYAWSPPVLEEDAAERKAWGIFTFRLRAPLPPRGLGYLAALAWGQWAFERVWEEQGPFDLVHAHIFRAGLVAALGAKRHQVPMLVTEHSSAVARGRLRPVDRIVAAAAYRAADLLCPVSENLGRAMRRLAPRTPVRVVGNTVDRDIFHPPVSWDRSDSASVRMLFVGRLHEVKGLDVLFDALTLLEQDPDTRGRWRLDLVGDGPMRQRLAQMAQAGGFASRLRFVGYLPRRQVAEAMRNADLFVLPSRWENMPCVLLEALACGLPAVASRVGGIPEVLDPAVGILAPPGDPDALAAALRDAILDMGRFQRQKVAVRGSEFGFSAVGKQLLDCYQLAQRGS